MLSGKSLTLVGSNVFFLGLAALLYFHQSWAIGLFPLFSVVFFWTDLRGDEEAHTIFTFLAVAAGLIILSRIPDGWVRLGLAIEMVGIVLISLGLGFHRTRLTHHLQRVLAEVREIEGQIQDLGRDLNLYTDYETTTGPQIQLRRDLTEAAKSLGGTLDPEEVQRRLVRVLEGRYPKSRVRILPGQPDDPLVTWAAQNRSSVLVKDILQDDRFPRPAAPCFRCAVVSPLMVLKRPFGFLQLESEEPAAFKPDDLRTLDLFTTLATLSLENIQLFRSVNDLALHDPLTQLFTHRAFQGRLEEEILRSARSQMPFSLIMCDVDHFKRYNDTYGHQAGDHLLQTVAGILVQYARPVDFVARYGGEEFAVLLPGTDHPPAFEFADRLRARVAEEPFLFQGHRTGVTMSFGVAAFPKDATTASQLVRAADERLYRAKHGGRNQVVG